MKNNDFKAIKPICNTVTNQDDSLQVKLNLKSFCIWQWVGNFFQAKVLTKNKPKSWTKRTDSAWHVRMLFLQGHCQF